MIDNFDDIKSILKFEKNDFYRIMILTRKKDTGETSRVLKIYQIESMQDLDKLKDEIISMCQSNNARAYIDVNVKNKIDVNKTILLELVKNLDNPINYNNLIEHSIGITKSKRKIWVVDVDYCDVNKEIAENIKKYCNAVTIKIINTKNGFHILTNPFNTSYIETYYPMIQIHKNNCTLLYIS